MKHRAFILFLLMLAMALTPCSDVVAYATGETMIAELDSSEHNHSKEETEMCTPFCICQCCGMSIAMTTYSTISELIPTYSNSLDTFYTSTYFYDYSKGIFQPPTLS